MNCTVCGGPYVLGSDLHKNCRIAEQHKRDREARIDAMLKWWEDLLKEGHHRPNSLAEDLNVLAEDLEEQGASTDAVHLLRHAARSLNPDRLHTLVDGALRDVIHQHGPITPNFLPSARKRVIGQILGYANNRHNWT